MAILPPSSYVNLVTQLCSLGCGQSVLPVQAVGDGTGVRPIYEVATATKGLPFLQPQPEPFMRHITAKECCGHPPVTFNRVEKVRAGESRGSEWTYFDASSARGLCQRHCACIRDGVGPAHSDTAQPRNLSTVCQLRSLTTSQRWLRSCPCHLRIWAQMQPSLSTPRASLQPLHTAHAPAVPTALSLHSSAGSAHLSSGSPYACMYPHFPDT